MIRQARKGDYIWYIQRWTNMRQVRIDGLRELQKDFDRLTKGFDPDQITEAGEKAAKPIRDDARQRVPYRTGKLHDAILVKKQNPGKDYASVIAAVDRVKAPHAHLVHDGTFKMAPRPFFRQAVESQGNRAAKIFKDELKKMVNKAVR